MSECDSWLGSCSQNRIYPLGQPAAQLNSTARDTWSFLVQQQIHNQWIIISALVCDGYYNIFIVHFSFTASNVKIEMKTSLLLEKGWWCPVSLHVYLPLPLLQLLSWSLFLWVIFLCHLPAGKVAGFPCWVGPCVGSCKPLPWCPHILWKSTKIVSRQLLQHTDVFPEKLKTHLRGKDPPMHLLPSQKLLLWMTSWNIHVAPGKVP